MKIFVLSAGLIIFFSSCKSNNNYTVEINYKRTVNGIDSSFTNTTESFTGNSDSAAYLKGQKDFNDAQNKPPDDKKGVAVKFIVRNNKGNVVAAPASYKIQ